MAILGMLDRAGGQGRYRVVVITQAVTGTATIVTGLSEVLFAEASVQAAGTATPTYTAGVSSVVAGSVGVTVTELEAAATAVAATAISVSLLAIGS